MSATPTDGRPLGAAGSREASTGSELGTTSAPTDDGLVARGSTPEQDAKRVFTGIAESYERVATVFSLGQDPRWRRALVEAIDARPTDRVLDVATGTGLVAQAVRDRFGCSVVGLDQSPDMLRVARARVGVYEALVEGSADHLPFDDESFDHVTFTYLLRYVDDPAATMRELARVVRPGGRIAMVEFGLPVGVWQPLWRLYTRLGLPLGGRLVSAQWFRVGAFLGPSIERFHARNPADLLEAHWRQAGLEAVHVARMSLGGGIVMSATKGGRRTGSRAIHAGPLEAATPGAVAVLRAAALAGPSGRAIGSPPSAGSPPAGEASASGAPPPGPSVGREAIAPPMARLGIGVGQATLAPAFYARPGGGWRDYWTLLHPPYTAWHLSYVLLGAALAPAPDPRIVAGALVAFGLAVGVAAHAFDELNGRPLRTRIPRGRLIAMGGLALVGAVALGLVATAIVGLPFLAFVAAGAAIVLLYAFDVPPVHSDLGFAIGWGAFPVAATASAAGAHPLPIALASLAATLLSLAQRRLSTRARAIRRRAVAVQGEVSYADGSREPVDANALIAAPEAALSVLWLAALTASLAVLLAHWL